MEIPQELFDMYQTHADDFITDNFGVNCKLVYPARMVPCASCAVSNSPMGHKNFGKSGSPMGRTLGCSQCGGDGFKTEEQGDTIQLRVYYDSKNWVKIAGVNIPDADAQVIGFIHDLPKYQKCNFIITDTDQQNYKTWTFEKLSDAMPWGFKHNRYFVAFIKRA